MQTPQGLDATHGDELFPVLEFLRGNGRPPRLKPIPTPYRPALLRREKRRPLDSAGPFRLSGKRAERSERGEPGEFDRMSDEELREAVDARARELGYVPVRETQHPGGSDSE
jgi:hypothetical protein